MKAIIQDRYGPADAVLRLREVDQPVTGDGEVLVRVRAASMHVDIWHLVTGRPMALRLAGNGLLKPRRPDYGDRSGGQVESVGPNVTRFTPGEEVLARQSRCRGRTVARLPSMRPSGRRCWRSSPPNVSSEQAATVPTCGTIALGNPRGAGKLKAAQNVLINGAGRRVGALAVQIAKVARDRCRLRREAGDGSHTRRRRRDRLCAGGLYPAW